MKVEINISRLEYLLTLYKISVQEFLSIFNKDKKRIVKKEEIFAPEINLQYLQRIDRIFNRGLSFYLDPSDPVRSSDASIFFRKSQFNADLNLKSKKIVNEFEELKLSLSAIAKLADIDYQRTLPIFTVSYNAKDAAREIRKIINYSFVTSQKEFLKHLINKLAAHNVLVFEFVETWNQIERANIDGVFLTPNVIVLKRLEGYSFKREIFTLAHELGHYLLNIEEVERIDYDVLASDDVSPVEKWCNEFAFYFLIGDYISTFDSLPFADESNDYNHGIIGKISVRTHLSELALFTKLLFKKKINHNTYLSIKSENERKAREFYNEMKKEREIKKASGKDVGGGSPQPIKSDLLISIAKTAFYEGVIDEYQFCKTLKIKPEKISNYIQ